MFKRDSFRMLVEAIEYAYDTNIDDEIREELMDAVSKLQEIKFQIDNYKDSLETMSDDFHKNVRQILRAHQSINPTANSTISAVSEQLRASIGDIEEYKDSLNRIEDEISKAIDSINSKLTPNTFEQGQL